MRIVYKFRSSRLEVLHKKYLMKTLKVLLKVFMKTPVVESYFNKIARPVTVLE